MTIPKLWGPDLYPNKPGCFLEQEGNNSLFTLENESGWLLLEQCPKVLSFLLELETETGTVLLENGSGSIELEIGP
jgi:hypothetical protein